MPVACARAGLAEGDGLSEIGLAADLVPGETQPLQGFLAQLALGGILACGTGCRSRGDHRPLAHGGSPPFTGFDAQTLYLHGSVASQSLITAGTDVRVTVTLADGLVLARLVFEQTINYRSAMIYGRPRMVTDPAERLSGPRCGARPG